MDKKNLKIYSAKEIFLGYITTINPDSYTVEGQIVKSVLALKKQRYYKKQTVFIPVDTFFPYYSIDYTVPISKKRKHASTWITSSEIAAIVEREKQAQQQQVQTAIFSEENAIDKKFKQKISQMDEELDINKVKKLVV